MKRENVTFDDPTRFNKKALEELLHRDFGLRGGSEECSCEICRRPSDWDQAARDARWLMGRG